MVTFALIGLFDLLAGFLLIAGGLPYLPGNGLVISMAAIMFLKGGWFLLSELSMSSGRNNWNVYAGAINLVCGVLIAVIYLGFFHPVFYIPGILVLLNGAWNFVKGFTN
jgi:hypothetical protein